MKQLDGKEENLEAAEIEPIDMSMQVMKEVGAMWLVRMVEYINENPEFIVNGFVKSGMSEVRDVWCLGWIL